MVNTTASSVSVKPRSRRGALIVAEGDEAIIEAPACGLLLEDAVVIGVLAAVEKIGERRVGPRASGQAAPGEDQRRLDVRADRAAGDGQAIGAGAAVVACAARQMAGRDG